MDLTPNELAALAVWDLFHDKCRLWVIFVGSACSRRSRLVRFAPKADMRELTAICHTTGGHLTGASSPCFVGSPDRKDPVAFEAAASVGKIFATY